MLPQMDRAPDFAASLQQTYSALRAVFDAAPYPDPGRCAETACCACTWNCPLVLAVAPLTAALAAGNRAMVKPSEFTPHVQRRFRAARRADLCAR